MREWELTSLDVNQEDRNYGRILQLQRSTDHNCSSRFAANVGAGQVRCTRQCRRGLILQEMISKQATRKMASPAAIFVVLQTCNHPEHSKAAPPRSFVTINYRTTFQNLANKHHHPPIGDERDVLIDLSPGESGPWTRVDGTMVAGDVLGSFDTLKYARIHVCCIEPALQPTSDQTPAQPSALAALMNAAKEKIVPSKNGRTKHR